MSVNAEVKSKVYNFKMYNLQQSLKKNLLKTRNSRCSLQVERRGLQGAVAKLSSQGKGWVAHRYPTVSLASTTILHRSSMWMFLLRENLTWKESCSQVFYKPWPQTCCGTEGETLATKTTEAQGTLEGWVVHTHKHTHAHVSTHKHRCTHASHALHVWLLSSSHAEMPKAKVLASKSGTQTLGFSRTQGTCFCCHRVVSTFCRVYFMTGETYPPPPHTRQITYTCTHKLTHHRHTTHIPTHALPTSHSHHPYTRIHTTSMQYTHTQSHHTYVTHTYTFP